MLSKHIFKLVKNKIPRISPTELIALQSGNTSLDREILNGKVELPNKLTIQNKLPSNMINDLLNNFDNTQ